MPTLLEIERRVAAHREQMCADARCPFLKSNYRCGKCLVCAAEGRHAEQLDEDFPCGFYCDCMTDYFDRLRARAEQAS